MTASSEEILERQLSDLTEWPGDVPKLWQRALTQSHSDAKLAPDSARKRTPLGRIVSWGIAGVDPRIMGIGPVPASRMALSKAGLTLKDIDLFEVNEAFAGQYLAVEKELGLDRDRVNVNGGAIALGHPLGATGTRLILTALLELRRRQGHFALATACIGGGQGIAIILERI